MRIFDLILYVGLLVGALIGAIIGLGSGAIWAFVGLLGGAVIGFFGGALCYLMLCWLVFDKVSNLAASENSEKPGRPG
jgi:uncharacterized membrane protein